MDATPAPAPGAPDRDPHAAPSGPRATPSGPRATPAHGPRATPANDASPQARATPDPTSATPVAAHATPARDPATPAPAPAPPRATRAPSTVAAPDLRDVSAPGRLAGADEGISGAELGLAARNHGLPLEALRYDTTPPGLHYVLVHYDIPDTTADDWRLTVGGRVRRPLSLDLAALRARPAVTHRVTLECAGNGRARLAPRPISQPWLVEAVGTADWTGVPLAALLAEAGVEEDAVEAVFTGADHGVERGTEQDYRRALPLTVAAHPARDVLVAYAMNGAPLPPQHGHPLRLVVPGWYGMASVKWLRDITVTDTPFTGFQQTVAYRYRQGPDDPGEPVDVVAPRALMIPPGFPDFLSRTRVVRPGPVPLAGRAWSGHGSVVRVELSTDGEETWTDTEVTADPARPWAWAAWRTTWTARPGPYRLTVRATDAAGHTQPLVAPWNRGGFGNNLVQRVDVVCLT